MTTSSRRPDEIIWLAVSWAGVAMISLNLPVSVIAVARNADAYRRWFAPTALVVLGLLWLVALRLCLQGRASPWPMQLTVGASLALLAAHPLAFHNTSGYPPLLHVLGAGICVSAALGIRLSAIVIIPAAAAYIAWIRTPELGAARAMAEALLFAVSGWLATFALRIIVRANHSVSDAVNAAAAAAEQTLRAQRRTFERMRWNALIHDKVLGALRIASRASRDEMPAAAVELAREAVTALRGVPVPVRPSPLAQAWRDHADRIGLSVDVMVTGDVDDPDVRNSLADAATEALSNISRHSGQRKAAIHGTLTPAGAVLQISDPGDGFVNTSHRYGAGITTSIIGRMRSVGGKAEIASAPGQGTTVTLTWSVGVRQRIPSEWQLRLFAPIMTVGALAVVLNIALAAPQWRHHEPAVIPALAVLVLCTVTGAATFLAPGERNWRPIFVTAAAMAAVMTLTSPRDTGTDWRYWFLGALTPAAGAMAFRFRPWVGLGLAVAATTSTCLADAVMGRPFWQCLVGPVPVLLVTAVAGQVVRAAFDDAYARAASASADDNRSRLATAIADERRREDDRRVSVLEQTVGPALEHIAGGQPVTPDLRDHLGRLESATRDQLAAPDLVDAELAQRLALARNRGVRVDMIDATAGEGQRRPCDSISLCRRVLGILLTEVPRRTQIRVVWRAEAGGIGATMSATKLDLGLECPKLSEAVASLGDGVDVTSDKDSLLVQFQVRPRKPAGSGHPGAPASSDDHPSLKPLAGASSN